MRNRIDKLGVSEPEIRKQGSNQIVIQLAGVHDPASAAKLIGKTAVLEFYDFETDLTGPSVTGGLQKVPVATGSLFGLLNAPETRALADKGTPSQWYLFDANHRVVAGPVPVQGQAADAAGGGEEAEAHVQGPGPNPARPAEHDRGQLRPDIRQLHQQPADQQQQGVLPAQAPPARRAGERRHPGDDGQRPEAVGHARGHRPEHEPAHRADAVHRAR
jgi:hypothetical protein